MKYLSKIILLAFLICQVFCTNCNCAELPPTLQWAKAWNSGVSEGHGVAIFTDSRGSDYYYITGYITGTNKNGVTIKYNYKRYKILPSHKTSGY